MDSPTASSRPSYSGPERRSNVRTDVIVQARLECGDTVLHGTIVNLSFGGALFVAKSPSDPLPEHAIVELTLIPIPNSSTGELHWTSTIVRVDLAYKGDPHRVAYGIRFDEATPRTKKATMRDTQTITCEV